jgi:hypothetical protein
MSDFESGGFNRRIIRLSAIRIAGNADWNWLYEILPARRKAYSIRDVGCSGAEPDMEVP